MARRAIQMYVTVTVVSLLLTALLLAQPASPTLAGFTPTPRSHGGGGGGGGGSDVRPTKVPAEPPAIIIAGSPTPTATPEVPTPMNRLPETGGTLDSGQVIAPAKWPQELSATPMPIPAPVAQTRPGPTQGEGPALLDLPVLSPAMSGGEVLFHDGFLPGGRVWKTNLATEIDQLDADGTLHLTVDSTRSLAWATTGKLFQGDIVAEVDVDAAQADSENYSCSLLARFRDAFNFYEFEIAADGTFAVWKIVDGDTATLVSRTPSSALLTGLAKNRLSLVTRGPEMTFGANGYQLATVTDAEFGDGDIGLVVRGDGQVRADVAFDNVEVRRLNASTRAFTYLAAEASPQASATPAPTINTPPAPQPTAIIMPPEWMPPPSQATLIVINDASADIVFTMGDQERKMPPHTKAAIIRPAGRYGFTANDPRFQPYRNECDLAGDSIYYWYTDDSIVSDRCVRLGP